MIIRSFTMQDTKAIADLFYAAVHQIPDDIYNQAQKEAWAPKPDYDLWAQRLLKTQPFIAEKQGVIVGFAEFDNSGYIDCFYVHPDFQKQHIGTFLYQYLEQQAIRQNCQNLTVYASTVAYSFFIKHGFLCLRENQVIRNDLILNNYLMTKKLFE
ncbi:GNAT family N-acetyltransferase [Zophobihabitans entericus]|uniref:GNAT family N-acetyltransferase n=1 Tax=Zophobihabitans entericus TaxID=1635327 RepID=A0A6G9I8F5_9GAMM|nr:GNAT family N-acetyltransferase [Zophobihabitans entericus]QIQ20493.1 GNAT family N-acetyltransferase [Zophobihabitans entericus]